MYVRVSSHQELSTPYIRTPRCCTASVLPKGALVSPPSLPHFVHCVTIRLPKSTPAYSRAENSIVHDDDDGDDDEANDDDEDNKDDDEDIDIDDNEHDYNNNDNDADDDTAAGQSPYGCCGHPRKWRPSCPVARAAGQSP